MLSKLIKYDTKKMSKILVYIYAITLGLACITRLINIGKDIQIISIVGSVFAGLTYSAMFNIIVNMFVHILKVFISSFYKDESYLTHTLPIKKNKLLLSKYISSIIVILTSVLVCFVSLFIMLYSKDFVAMLDTLLKAVVINLNMSVGLFITLMVIIIFAQICAMISFAFTAIIKGYSYNRKRGVKGLLWFFAFYFGSMIATLLIALIVFAITGNLSLLFAEQLTQGAFITILIIGLAMYIIYTILFFLMSRKEFNKGVNVD